MKTIILFLLVLFLSVNIASSQTRKAHQTNTEYVLEILKTHKIEHIYIVGVNKYFQYNKEWLNNIQTDGEYITFEHLEEEKLHSWDISTALFIERYRNVLKIRLSEYVGE